MATSAPHLTSLDFSLDAVEPEGATYEVRDVEFFFSYMIEIEDNRVSFATVDTRMGAQIVNYVVPITNAIPSIGLKAATLVGSRVLQVVIARVDRLTRFAVCVTTTVCAFIKLLGRQFAFARWATFCFITHGKAMLSKHCASSVAHRQIV